MTEKPTLVIDTENNQVITMAPQEEYTYSYDHDAEHWKVRADWLKPVISDEGMRRQLYRQARLYWQAFYRHSRHERVRENWFHRNGLWADYIPKPITGPVPLKFSLWDQAETRHKGDKAVRTNE